MACPLVAQMSAAVRDTAVGQLRLDSVPPGRRVLGMLQQAKKDAAVEARVPEGPSGGQVSTMVRQCVYVTRIRFSDEDVNRHMNQRCVQYCNRCVPCGSTVQRFNVYAKRTPLCMAHTATMSSCTRMRWQVWRPARALTCLVGRGSSSWPTSRSTRSHATTSPSAERHSGCL